MTLDGLGWTAGKLVTVCALCVAIGFLLAVIWR